MTAPLAAIGGLDARHRLHAVHPARPGHGPAAAGFALAMILSLKVGPILWVVERQAAQEDGWPYGPGLAEIGLDPARLMVVAVKGAMHAFAAAEMGLDDAGLAGVLVDLPPRLPADMLRLGKRLSLRAEARATPCLLLHATAEPIEAPVASRWLVASRPVSAGRHPDFATAFDLELAKNRSGPLGRWTVAWHLSSTVSGALRHGAFVQPSLSRPVVPEPADRPAASPGEAQRPPLRLGNVAA